MRGCLIALGVLVLVGVASSAYLWSRREAILESATEAAREAMELPEYATEEAVFARYGPLVDSLDRAAEESESFFQFAAAVEKADLGPEVLYVGIEEEDEERAVLERFDWSGHSFTIVGETGYGTLRGDGTTRSIVIVKREGAWPYMDAYVVYLAHTESAGDGSPHSEP